MKALMDLTAQERRYLILRCVWAATDLFEAKQKTRYRPPSVRDAFGSLSLDLDIDVDSQVRHPFK